MRSVWQPQRLPGNALRGVSCCQFFCVLFRFLSFATEKKSGSRAEGYYQFIGDFLVMIFGILPVCILCVFSHSDVKQDNVKIEGLLQLTVSERDYRSVI